MKERLRNEKFIALKPKQCELHWMQQKLINCENFMVCSKCGFNYPMKPIQQYNQNRITLQ